MDRTRFLNVVLALIATAGMLTLVGCGEASTDDAYDTSTQELTGSIPADSAPDRPDIVAVDERGTEYLFDTDEAGGFHLALPAGHTYELYVSEQGTRGLEQASQLVFPRADGDVDDSVTIGGAMAPFDLGEVRPAGTMETANYQLENASAEDRRQDGDAEDRGDQATGDEQSGEQATGDDAAGDDATGDEAETDDEESGDQAADDDAEAMDCAEGAPGLFCIHDGLHPACEGLAIAAANRGEARGNADRARQNADQGRQMAEQARLDAEQDARQTGAEQADAEQAGEHMPDALEEHAGPESEEERGPIDNDRPIALPQFNPPFEFLGCSGQ